MRASELADRGIWWQVVGFTLVGCISLAILELFAGSDAVAYQWFETAVTRLYWAFVVTLAGAFDGGQKLFAKASETRRAVREKIREKGRQEGLRDGRQEGLRDGRQEGRQEGQRDLAAQLRRHATRDATTGRMMLEITPEVAALLDDADESD